MGFYSGAQHVRVVRIDDENTVTVRRLSFGETQDVIGKSTRLDIVTQEGTLDFAANQLLKMEMAIVGWDGPGFEGRKPTRENIAALPVTIGQIISKAVEEINANPSEDERKN